MTPEAMMAILPTSRTCADCDLCCTAVGVSEIRKKPGVRCRHLDGAPGRSCTIYADRPDSCAQFVCLWRISDHVVPASLFPASCGFVVAIGDVEGLPLVVTVHPDPDRPDAWDTPEARAYFHRIARQLNACVAIGQGNLCHTLFSPTGKVFTKDRWPELFVRGGRSVGLPSFEYLTRFRTPGEIFEFFRHGGLRK